MALNIIKATFYDKPCAWTDEQWQWDYGQILQFEGLELPEAYEVHFSNIAIGGESITQIGGENGVTIPDQFFTTGETIYAWVYLHQGEDDGETVYSVTIPIKKRPKPSDTPPTPQEQSVIDQAIAALNAAVVQTAEDVETTTENAEQAAASAENAAASAEEASGYLEGVTAKANEAAASASSAAQSATTATEKAEEVASGIARAEQAATDAEAAKTAAQSAQAAAEAAVGRAESYAGEASRSAQAASTSATQAAGSATSASGFAGDANTAAQAAASSATTASTKAGEAAQSASTASTAATNAGNAQTAAETAQGKAEDAQEAAETAQEAAETAVESIQGKAEQIDQNTEDIGDLKAEINHLSNNKADIIFSNASGAIASFVDGADGLPMESVVAHIEPVQSGTGDPSPTNIRPISGWTGANVAVSPTEDAQDGTTYTVSWQTEAGTIYGGTVDLVSGKLSVNMAIVDLASLAWTYRSEYTRFEDADLRGVIKAPQNNSTLANILCTAYTPSVASGMGTTYTLNVAVSSDGKVLIADSNYTDVQTFVASLSGQKLVYELATPIEYDLTPQEITSLLGVNNVFADTGDTDVTYRADTKLYLESHAPKVNDVQVNGTSIVNQGVADIPIGNGLKIHASTHDIVTDYADLSVIKTSNGNFRPITPYFQDASVFYGLAKAAGSSMGQSSNPVGTYTDAAKVAIQKMLGIYEAPWELIREDTFTFVSQGNIEISVDDNGEPFELTDVYAEFILLQQDVDASVGSYGRVRFYIGNANVFTLYMGAWNQAAGATARSASQLVEQKSGAVNISYTKNALFNGEPAIYTLGISPSKNVTSRMMFYNIKQFYTKIVYEAITGTAKIRMYGKRKWS